MTFSIDNKNLMKQTIYTIDIHRTEKIPNYQEGVTSKLFSMSTLPLPMRTWGVKGLRTVAGPSMGAKCLICGVNVHNTIECVLEKSHVRKGNTIATWLVGMEDGQEDFAEKVVSEEVWGNHKPSQRSKEWKVLSWGHAWCAWETIRGLMRLS